MCLECLVKDPNMLTLAMDFSTKQLQLLVKAINPNLYVSLFFLLHSINISFDIAVE